MSRINRACRQTEGKSFITSLGLKIPGTGKKQTRKSSLHVWEQSVGSAWWWARLGIIHPFRLEKTSKVKGTDTWLCASLQSTHPNSGAAHRNSNHTKLLRKAAFANPPHTWQWHRLNYLAQSRSDTMTPGMCQQEKHNGKGSLISCASWNLMAPQYVTWSKFIHITHTTHSQVQEHFLCKYQIKQSVFWQFLAHATIRPEF